MKNLLYGDYFFSCDGGSICNENTFITPSPYALGFYTIFKTKDQSIALHMVYKPLCYLSNLFRLQALKIHTHSHCVNFPPDCKIHFNKVRKVCCIF